MSLVVVKLGGSSLEGTGRRLSRLAMPFAVVHGGGPQVSALSERLGVYPRKVAGRRITDEATLEAVLMALGGAVHNRIVASLLAEGVPAVGLAGPSILRAVRRPPLPIDGELVDFGLVGEIVSIDTGCLEILLRSGKVPVLPCIARGPQGELFNINADTVAARVAAALGAAELLQVTDSGGVRRVETEPSSVISELSMEEARALLAGGIAANGMRPKLESALAALEAGVPRVRILGIEDLGRPEGGTRLGA